MEKVEMLAIERQAKILEYIERNNTVRVKTLSKMFNVSVITIRRDLDVLASQGRVNKFYGGASLSDDLENDKIEKDFFEKREQIFLEEKRAIAREAVKLIQDRNTIYLGLGTTTAEIAKQINNSDIKKLNIATNSFAVANIITNTNLSVFMVGGFSKIGEAGVVGETTVSMIKSFFFDIAFIGTGGITFDGGITEFYLHTAEIRKAVLERSSKKVLVADHSKFGKKAFAVIGPITCVDTIITDWRIPPQFETGITNLDIRLIKAGR